MLSLVLAAAVSALNALPPPEHHCPSPPQTPTASGAPLKARKLADLPDANQVLLVMRTIDGCAYQQVVRFRVSAPAIQRQGAASDVLVPDGAQVLPASPSR